MLHKLFLINLLIRKMVKVTPPPLHIKNKPIRRVKEELQMYKKNDKCLIQTQDLYLRTKAPDQLS